ncbi:MAG: ABC transporter ATP-binding protein, partial [Halobacteriaceae archaeon]
GKLNSRLENNLGGIEVIKAYNKEEFENERVEDASQDYLDANWDAISTRIKFFPSLQLTTGLGFVLTFLVGGIWVTFPERSPLTVPLTAGTLVTFLLYSRRFMWPMRQLGRIINNYQYAEAASERIIGLMNEPSKIDDNPNGIELDEIEGNVVYDDVSFAYEGSDEKTIKNVSFEAEAGDMVGLVGPTGAGKTTVMKLLLRLYDIDSGSIRIDGVDIQDVKLDNLREKISLVSQEPFLFYGTVRENIAYPDIDEETIIDAAKRSGAHQFIQELPDGYDTMVGERGVKLSGGQRQRVSIARAILKDPEILILDEATSHVDNETEVLIQNSLNELIADRTSFAIAHRLSTVRNADKIIVMEEGEVVERGTHEELLENDGLYANLWGVQVGEVESLPQEFIDRTARRRSELEPTD